MYWKNQEKERMIELRASVDREVEQRLSLEREVIFQKCKSKITEMRQQ